MRCGDRAPLWRFRSEVVCFGYPEAHEDDPDRAVRAGLELVAAVSGLQTPEPLEARVGIATGLVIVGDLVGSGASQEQAIVGKTPNLAARLQGIAAPNTVVIADSTRKLLGNLFEFEDFGGKGIEANGSFAAVGALSEIGRPRRVLPARVSRSCTGTELENS